MGRTLRLGTRGSDLAVTQSRWVAARLGELAGVDVELVVIRTKGDAVRDRPLHLVGGKGLFTKEIEDAMLAGDVDLAVHSMKDMPTEGPAGLVIAGVPVREDPRDVLVGASLDALAEGAVVGTGSNRRRLQLLAVRPDLDVRGIRGNVETRIGKQRSGEYDAVVLAAAGMKRLGLEDDITALIDVETMVPAVGQGALAVQCREDDAELVAWLEALTDRDTADTVAAERGFLGALGGGCSVPAACHAVVDGDGLIVRAFLGDEEGRFEVEVARCARAEGAAVGAEIARHMKAAIGG